MDKHWTDSLSEYLDGHLDPADRREVERHLETCGECRGVLEDLKAVVLRAQGLQDREPAQDLWPSIAAVLASRGGSRGAPRGALRGQGAGDVLRLEEHRGTEAPARPSYVRVTMPQLAAAGLVLMMASGAGAWMLRPGPDDTTPAPFASSSAIRMASQGDGLVSPYADEVAVLQEALSQLADVLAPSTVRIIQKNLIIIDQAIEESAEALRNDPNDSFLKDYLDRVFRRKVEYLRETAAIVGAEI